MYVTSKVHYVGRCGQPSGVLIFSNEARFEKRLDKPALLDHPTLQDDQLMRKGKCSSIQGLPRRFEPYGLFPLGSFVGYKVILKKHS